jgi:ketosteroid isomerase-like protein
MKTKDINKVMSQFSDDATFINSDGYFLATKKEIAAFHKA